MSRLALLLQRLTLAVGLLLAATATAIEGDAPSTADHSRFEILQQDFASGPEVTEACLSCHTEAASQLQESLHWTWEFEHPDTGQLLGKRHVVNSFCGTVASNEPRCTSCHAGYGWEDMREPAPTAERQVDCLVCHDTTGEYWKVPTEAGHPLYEPQPTDEGVRQPPNLGRIARNVGPSGRANCGSCHFYGGGADGVKHGDLDSSLEEPPRGLDVHMSPEGAGLVCSDCHTAGGHQVTGSRYATKPFDPHGIDVPGHSDETRSSCASCHGNAPHGETKVNDHIDRVACQSCHVPEFARGGVATKTWWDWSTAGKLDEDGNPIERYDEQGHIAYLSTKGDFRHGEDVVPDYYWFDGVMRYTLRDEVIDPDDAPVAINRFDGGPDDPNARLWPFKTMHGRQPYDAEYHTLLVNHVFGDDDTALWTNFDWAKALEAGTAYAGQPYSGEFGFVETAMYWPITHMVAPAEDAVTCGSCHARQGRLDALGGFYLPGRDRSVAVDATGWTLVALTLGGVLLHGVARIISRRRRQH
ncbi:tetrathionate reductase family octaheme c-type cytochrome [Arhodomonas sp. SL1]|uniref:tetrathionate reductase family octaheme c-type cytochrome n=1 Tax=Arhodomonas sp. SL1 TaxID=3425691 RepID=UPI003F884F32